MGLPQAVNESNVEAGDPARVRRRAPGLTIAGVIVGALVLVLGTLRVIGFEPYSPYPGMWIKGELVTTPVTDWSFAKNIKEGLREADGFPLALIETRERLFPLLAYSVTTSTAILDGKLYVGAHYVAGVPYPEGRHWNKNIVADPRVRIKIGTKLYDRALLRITDPVMDKALAEEWDRRRPHGSDPGLVKLWFEVVPRDDPRLTGVEAE
jgi:hypothetical protein